MIKSCRIFIFILVCVTHQANAEFVWTENCLAAYSECQKLNFVRAKQILATENKLNPENLIPVYIESQMDFITSFITEDKTVLEDLKTNNENRIEQLEKADEPSPYTKLCIGEMYIQMAIARVKFEEFIGIMYDTRKAYKILEDNKKLYPDFKPNLRGLGLIHSVIGALPKNYQWFTNLLGLDGNVKAGLGELRQLLAATYTQPELIWAREDLIVMLTFLEMNLEKDKNNISIRRRLTAINEINEKPLLLFAKGVFYYANAENDSLIMLLANRKQNAGAYQLDYLNFMEGIARLNKLDFSAEKSFLLYAKNYEGTTFRSASWQRLAWCRLLQNDLKGYQTYIQHCLDKTKGNTMSDEDKQAIKEATDKELPNTVLLRSRLLFDGGYYLQSLNEIAGKPISTFPKLRDQLELTYRLARIYDKTGKKDKAEQYYTQTMQNGDSHSFYYAANSALMLGLMKEDVKDTVAALSYYKKCFAMRNHEYQNSIDQKAKAGINRMGK